METKKLTREILCNTSFKSYYVVWKPHHLGFLTFIITQFKSYYVVWKLNRENAKKEKKIKFKSYYVVWKPSTRQLQTAEEKGLNRTM